MVRLDSGKTGGYSSILLFGLGFAGRVSANVGVQQRPNDFTAFRDKPLLRATSKLDLMDLWMLAEKFESGPFWLIHSNLSGKQRPLFHWFWGRLFERNIA